MPGLDPKVSVHFLGYRALSRPILSFFLIANKKNPKLGIEHTIHLHVSSTILEREKIE